MKKKIILFIIVILSLPFIVFNVYKLLIYNDFKNYLNEKYTGKTFKIDWVKYDFLYQRFISKVQCSSDGAEFPISMQGDISKFPINKQEDISEEYIKIRNGNTINSYVNSCLKNEDFNKYINDLSAGVEDEGLLGTEKEIEYGKLVYNVYINFNYNSITDNKQFAEITFEIISKLKNNNIKMNSISIDYEKGKEVYSLLLQSCEIDGQVTDIQNHIWKRK